MPAPAPAVLGGIVSIAQFCLEAATANGDKARTVDPVNVEFYVGQAWTAKQLFFHGAARDETRIATFTLESTPTKIRLSIDGNNGWAFWRITFGGVIIHENPDGDGTPEYETGTRFWIDGPDAEAVSNGAASIPASITIDIPSSTFSAPFIYELYNRVYT